MTFVVGIMVADKDGVGTIVEGSDLIYLHQAYKLGMVWALKPQLWKYYL